MSLYPVFEWCENTAIGAVIRDSLWLFPVIEAVHLLALAVIGGAVLLVDFRLIGWGLRRQTVRELARDAQPWLFSSLGMMLLTGFLLFTSEAVKCYDCPAFWVKMTSLSLAIVFTFTIRRWVVSADEGRIGPAWSKIVGCLSVLLWAGVGIGGRAIAFY